MYLTPDNAPNLLGKTLDATKHITTDTFICTETFVGDDYTFDQDFKDKTTNTTQGEEYINSLTWAEKDCI